jgi:hypothetical protein
MHFQTAILFGRNGELHLEKAQQFFRLADSEGENAVHSAVEATRWILDHPGHKINWNFRDGPVVGVHGLKSETGKKMNGQVGIIVVERIENEKSEDGKFKYKPARYPVRLLGDQADQAPKLLKPENLKTVWGVYHTNRLESGVYENICRINHSCVGNCVVHQERMPVCDDVDGGASQPVSVDDDSDAPPGAACVDGLPVAGVYSTRDVQAGEELVFDYIKDSLDWDELDNNPVFEPHAKQKMLHATYGFWCKCPRCAATPERD